MFKTECEVVEIKAKNSGENMPAEYILSAPFFKEGLEHPSNIKSEGISLDSEELSSMVYESKDPLKISIEDYSTVHAPNTNRKTIICNICQAKFTLFHNLTKHKRNIHKESNPFSCNECNISFPTHELQKKHLVIHSGKKPFSCNECGKSYKDNKRLVTHSIAHFSCRECTISFSTPGLKKAHMKIHMGKTYFQCPQCSFSFSSELDFKIHVKKGHPIKYANESKIKRIELEKSEMKKTLTASKMKNNIYLHPKLQGIEHKELLDRSHDLLSNKTTKTDSVETKIKRPLNAFMVFSKRSRRMLAESGLHQQKVSQELGRRWKELGQEEKVPYYLEADRLERELLRDNPDYIYKPGPKKRKPKSST